MSTDHPYLKAIASRRSIYALKPELPSGVTINDVQSIVQLVIKETPTAHNSQLNRAIILTGETHKKVWDSVSNAIEGPRKKRPQSIRDEAYGSVIFFTDDKTTEKLQAEFPVWAAAFPRLADHASGAVQISTWTALETLGLGGHLQHYNDAVKAALGSQVPASWSVHSQLCFGTPIAGPIEKTYIDNVVKVLN
ncbi:putative nitroreductase HBN1 [Nakaseomyces bracarensis]|uniref:Nitroreductase HBN1 n=1 Tax=Nakaseomyces bracarensis TaxID=273131 RepID=A0ABR4NYX0_9SACH